MDSELPLLSSLQQSLAAGGAPELSPSPMTFGNTSMTDILHHHRTSESVARFGVAPGDLSPRDSSLAGML
jgi:hypothetical protein